MRTSLAQAGYTLLELLVAIAILGILTALALPSFTAMMANNRAASQANTLVQVITAARSEAIKRNRQVALCKTSDGLACDSSEGAGWENGVLTFTFSDDNGDGSYDSTEAIATLIRTDMPIAPGSTIMGSLGVENSITYGPSGRGPLGGNFVIRPGGETTYQRKVVLYFGRPRVSAPGA